MPDKETDTIIPGRQPGSDAGGLANLWPIGRLIRALTSIIAPLTLLTGLLFYFGYTFTRALYITFGIDQSMFNFTSTNYLLRSTSVSFLLLKQILVAALIALGAHFALHTFLHLDWTRSHPRAVHGLLGFLLFVGIAFLILSDSQIVNHFYDYSLLQLTWWPLSFCIGVGLCFYVLYLIYQQNIFKLTGDHLSNFKIFYIGAIILGGVLLIIGLFWFSGNYAYQLGRAQAQYMVSNIDTIPDAILYSQSPLGLTTDGIQEVQVSQDENSYKWKYTGLKFLILSNGKYFLLPSKIAGSKPIVIILPDDDTIRIEVSPGVYVP